MTPLPRFSESDSYDRGYAAGYARGKRQARLSLLAVRTPCGTCRESGIVKGFWYGTIKTCPACHGKGYR